MNRTLDPSHSRYCVPRLALFFLALCALWLSPNSAQAANGNWVGISGSSWNTAGDWTNGGIPTASGQAWFSGTSANMTINLDAAETLAPSGGGPGGLVFTGTGYTGTTGYTIASSAGNALSLANYTWLAIDPNFLGSNITETVSAPVILTAANAYFANMTSTAASFRTGPWSSSQYMASQLNLYNVTNSGTNNLLVISGSVSNSIATTLSILGAGNGVISGNIAGGATALNILQDSTGAWTLSGSNSFLAASTTTIYAGSLTLDFTTVNAPSSKLNPNLAPVLGGVYGSAKVAMVGNATAPSSQSLLGVTLNAGADAFSVTSSTSALLQIGRILRNAAGVALDVTLPSGTQSLTNGVMTTTVNGSNGILGGWATVGQTDWASSGAVTTTNVVCSTTNNAIYMATPPAVGTEVLFNAAPAGLANNTNYYVVGTTGSTFQVSLTQGGAPIAITSNISNGSVNTLGNITPLATYANDVWSANNNTTVTSSTSVSAGTGTFSVRFNSTGASNTVTLGGASTIGSGGILATPNVVSPMVITGGTLNSGYNNELIVHQYSSAPMTIASTLGSNNLNTLSKVGSGTLILSGNNTLYGGNINLNAGKIQVGNANALGGYTNGAPSETMTIGAGAVLDLNGYSVAVKNLTADALSPQALANLTGSQVAALGLIANVTNSAPGTLSTLTIGNPVSQTRGTAYYGGFNEVPGSILSLNYLGVGVGPNYPNAVGGFTNSNNLDQDDFGSSANTITGGVTVGLGASWGPTNGALFNMNGAFTLNGWLQENGKTPIINATYLQGNGMVFTNSGNSAQVTVSLLGSATDVSNIHWGTSTQQQAQISPAFQGSGTILMSQPIFTNMAGFDIFLGGASSVITPSIGVAGLASNNTAIGLIGEGTFKLTASSGNVLSGAARRYYAGAVVIAPSGSGQNVAVTAGKDYNGNSTNAVFGGGASYILDAGANTSLTMTEVNINPVNNVSLGTASFGRVNFGTMTLGVAQGLSALGTTDKLNMIAANPAAAFPLQTNGICPVWMVGANTSATPSTLNGTSYPTSAATFLSYTYTGASGAATDTGFAPYAYPAANINNINGSTASSIELVNSGTQTLTGWGSMYTLEVDNATVNTGSWNVMPSAMILNGGTILGLSGPSGQGIKMQNGAAPYDFPIYVSNAGGTISSNITGSGSIILNKFGPGILTLTSTSNAASAGGWTQTTINAGVVDVGPINGASSGTLPSGIVNLRGGVLQASGSLTMGLGLAAGQVNWEYATNDYSAGGGGFSARGGPLTVTITSGGTNALLTWGGYYLSAYNQSYFLSEGGMLNFGSTNSDNVLNFVNNIDLGIYQMDTADATGGYSRVVSVVGNTNDSTLDPLTVADYTVLSGTIQSTNPFHGLTKTGNGVMALTGSNTYVGATSIAAGALVINADANLGVPSSAPYPVNTTPGINGGAVTPGAIVIDGGAALASGTATAALTISANRSILLGSGTNGSTPSNIDVYTGNTLTFGGLIGDYIGELGNLGKIGGGTLVISGSQANPFTGGLTINNGTVQNASPNSANVLGSGNVSFGTANSPTLDLNGRNVTVGLLSGAGSNGVVTSSTSGALTVTLAGSGTQSFAGVISNGSGTVAVTVAGGKQILTGANSFTGAVTLGGSGTLQATNAGLNASDLTNGIVFNGGALQAGAGGISTAKAVAMTGAGTFDTNGNNSTLSGNITGTGGALSKAGSGTLVLSGLNNTFSAGLTVNNGTVQAGSGAGTAVLGSGNIGFGTTNSPTVDLNGNSVTVGLLSGLGTNGVITSSVAGPVTLTLAGSGNQAFGGSVQDGAGQVSLTVNSGAQILTGVSSYSGQTSVNGGSLTVTGTGAIPASAGLSIGGNGAFNFVTGTTGQVLTVQNLTTPYDSGTSTFGVEVGNSINVVHSPTGYRTLAVNLFGVLGTTPDPTFSGTQITVLTAPDSLDNYIGYILGNVYGATNFTVTVPPASNNPSTGFGNTVSMQITGATPLASATWQGAFAAGNNVWAISNGSTASNWTTTGGASTSLVPGAVTNVTFSSTSANVGNMSLGANMAINSLTTSATSSMVLQDAINTLTVSGTKGIAVNAGSGTVNLNVGLVLNGAAAQALTANNATGLLISGPINSGTGGILVNGTNVLTLSGNNSFAGPVTVSAGTTYLTGADSFNGALTLSGGILNTPTLTGAGGLAFNGGYLQQAGAGGINSTKSITMTAGGTIDTNGNNATISGVIAGSGVLAKSGTGILTLNGANPGFTGGVTLNCGTLQIAPNTSGSFCGGTLTFSNTNSLTLDLNDNAISVGTLVSSAIGQGNGASYITNNALDSGTGTLTISVASSVTNTLTSNIWDGQTGKVGLIKTGTGTLLLYSWQNNFSGGIQLLSGTLQGSSSGGGGFQMGTGIITFGTAAGTTPTVDINGGPTFPLLQGGTNAVVVNSAAGGVTLALNGMGTATFAGTIAPATGGGVISLSMNTLAGTEILTGSNSIGGTITLNGGILNATTLSMTGTAAATNTIAFSGGTLQAGPGGIVTGRNITVGSNGPNNIGATIDTNGNNVTLSGTISSGGTFYKNGQGTLTLTCATNTFGGLWDLNGGILNVTNGSFVSGSTQQGILFTGGTLQAGAGGISTAKTVSIGANAIGGMDTNGQGPSTLSGAISGPGGLAKSGTDVLILSGINSFSGGLSINNGTVQSGAANVGEFGSGTVTFGASNTPVMDLNGHSSTVNMLSGGTNGTVTSSASGTILLTLSGIGPVQSFAGVISPGLATSLALTKSGTGTQILTGSNTYTGATTINGGILSTNLLASGSTASGIGQSGSAAANLVLNAGSTLQYTGPGASIDRLFTMAGACSIDASGSGPLVFTNTGALAQTGATTLTLTGSNTGANTLNMGIAQGTGGTVLVKSGPGTWVLAGTSSNIFQGGLTITGGILAGSGISNTTNTFGVQNEAITFNGSGATLQATGSLYVVNGSVVLTSNGIIDSNGNGVGIYDAISGAGALIKQGSGTLTLGYGVNPGNSFTGGLTINNGTVALVSYAANVGRGTIVFGASNTPTLDLHGVGASGGLLSGGANALVTNSGTAATTQALTLTGTGTGTATFAGTIQNNPNVSGSGGYVSVSVNGGTQVLSGNNTYTGSTIVTGSASVLIVSGSLSGTSYIQLQNGGTLGGAGIATLNSVTVAASGGTVAPGNLDGSGVSTEGTLSMNGLDLSAGGTNAHLSMQLGGTAVNGIVPSDTVKLGTGLANVTNADLLTSLVAGYTPTPGDTFFLVINGGGVTGTFATVNGLVGSYGQDQVFAINGVNYELSYNAAFNGGVGSVFDGTGHDIALMVAVPEPGTWALLVGGMGMLGLWQRRRSKI